MNIRELKFKDTSHQCMEADAVWDQINGDASYEVSPLIGDDSQPYAWEANYYTDHRNCHSFRADPKVAEHPTKREAIEACQKHNKERCIAMIDEMLA